MPRESLWSNQQECLMQLDLLWTPCPLHQGSAKVYEAISWSTSSIGADLRITKMVVQMGRNCRDIIVHMCHLQQIHPF